MPITIWPVDAVSGAPSFTGRKLRQALGVLLGGATAARPLGGRSGVRPGTIGLGSATSTTWTVNPHAGALDLEAASAAAPYYYSVDDTSNTGTVTAADGTNGRLDLVYVTVNDPVEGDGSSTPSVTFGYQAGIPAATPVAPSAPARSMGLFTISVPKSGTGSPTTADVAPFTAAAGAPIPVRSQADRDALTKYPGLSVARLDEGGTIQTCDGTNWGDPFADFYRGVGGTVPNGSPTQLAFPNQVALEGGMTYSAGNFTVPTAGKYRCTFNLTFPGAAGQSQIGAQIFVNGALYALNDFPGGTVANWSAFIARTIRLNAGDVVSFYAFHNSTAPVATTADIHSTWAQVEKTGA